MPELLDQRYELHELLGKGAEGEVHSAWDRELGKLVAVKLLSASNPQTLCDEFQLAAAMRHPNLVAVHDLGQVEGRLYYTMDLVRGVAAHEIRWAGESGPSLARFLRQCLAALDFLHGRGLIHRDLKPGNLLVSGTGIERGGDPHGLYRQASRCPDLRVRVADFGLLCSAAAPAPKVAGTVPYLPPEAFEDRPGPAWDLYCLGITLYELVTESLPPDATSLRRFLRQPEPLPDFRAGPAWLPPFVARLTAPYPEQRYPSARAALTELDRLCPADPAVCQLQQCELVGRAQDLAALERQIEEAFRQRNGTLLQIVGPPGAGKSRLLREVAVRAQARGTSTWMHSLQAGSAALWISAGESLPPPAEAAAERSTLLLSHLDRHYRSQVSRPTLLLLDDADCMEPGLAQVLERFRSVLADRPLVVLLAAREAPLGSWPVVELPALDGESVAELACGLTGSTGLRPQFRAQLERHAGGNPGQVSASLDGLARSGAIQRVAGIWSFELEDLPERVWNELPGREGASQILDALGPQLRLVLRWAALLGASFQEEPLAVLTGASVLAQLEQLSLRGLLATSGSDWRFLSDELRKSCLEDIPEADRPSAHDQVADVLPLDSVAGLHNRAQGSDVRLAVQALRTLARHWRQEGLTTESVDALRRALDLATGESASAVRLELAKELLDLGESAQAARLLEADLAAADPQCRLLHAKALIEQSRHTEAADLLIALEPICRDRPDLDAQRLQHLAHAWLQTAEPERARDCLGTALELARQAGDTDLQARLMGSLGKLLVGLSRLPEAREAYEASLGLFRQLQDRRRMAVCLNGLAVIEWQDGKLRQAADLLEAALQLQDECGLLDAQLSLRLNLGLARFQLGQLGLARALYAQASALAARIDASPAERLRCLNNVALVELRLGTPEQARALLQQALELSLRHDLVLEEAVVRGNLGDACRELGEPEEARLCFEASFRQAEALGAQDVRIEGLRRLGEAALDRADLQEAGERLHLAIEEATAHGLRLEEGKARVGLGRLQLQMGRITDCRMQLDAAISLFRALEAPFELADALGTLAFVPVAAGQDVVPEALDEALQLYRDMGVRHRMQQLEERKKALAVTRSTNTRAKLETLLETTVSLSRNLELEPLLADIVAHVLAFTGAERAVVFLQDDSGHLRPRIAQGRQGQRLDPEMLQLSHGVLDQVIRSGEAVCLTDLESSPLWRERRSIVTLGLRSVLCVPLQIEGRLLGVLYVDSQSTSGSAYTREDLSFLQALGSHAALAIHKAQTHQDLVRSYQVLQESRDQLEQTVEQLRQTQDVLLKAEKMAALGQLAASVAHDLSQPLFTVLIGGEVALLGLDSFPASEATASLREQIGTLLGAAEHMSSILESIRRFSRPSQELRRPLALGEVLQSTLQLVQHTLTRDGIVIEAEPQSLPSVLGDLSQMMQVFTNLLTNARDALAGQKKARVRIHGGRDAQTGEGLVWIRDNGPGVPEELRERIFESYFTTKSANGGTGLGLAIIRQILEKYGGSIRLCDNPGDLGACFELRFPPHSPT